MEQEFYIEIIGSLKEKQYSERELTKLKRDLALKHKLKKIPTNIEVLLHADVKDIPALRKVLLTKPVRTISGVSPLAIMTAPHRCPHGKCTFCPGGIGSPWGDVPQSYTGHEPATMRAIRNKYDPYLIVFNRLEQYAILGHSFDKVEFIIMGGTFPSIPKANQEEVIKDAYRGLNDFAELFFDAEGEFDFLKFKEFFELPGDIHNLTRTNAVQEKILKYKQKRETTLEEEQQRNETAEIRCVALCIETKPDWGFLDHGNEMLRQGCTRVELGIESVYDDVLKIVHRGHTAADSIKSIQILRDLGFKINFHYMPGLPLTDKERDAAGMKQLFTDQHYRPDMIKMYPCMVGPGTALYQQYKLGKFTPLTTAQAADLLVEWKKEVPEYCRIQRIQRDVPTKYWEAGVDLTNLRQYMLDHYDVRCRCIRCREPKGKVVDWNNVKIKVMEYEASNGKEFFIAAEDITNDILIGFCRLRFPGQYLRSEITPASALIRELHVYGTATAIGEDGVVQHRGWGKKLMEKAEEIAKHHGKEKMVVIAGVGVREYYRLKLGYEREWMYMVKKL
ncbi:TPA: tRNA uridine(34) 5-carboxymethylaminomethyl modification radical SAM/GNAT enzyme Elp3 [Candidatus Woesearchaeota archaeon]|nr:tRNA uridine(34) 5-carboxymethylaminomethyl modification radical SAM/GNAT enzyme Elp3 [Candidatus Woesearchaeota archaeon]